MQRSDGSWPLVGIVGSRGVVGQAFLTILAERGLPADHLRLYGQSEGETSYRAPDGLQRLTVALASEESMRELDVLFLATDASISRDLLEGTNGAARNVPLVVDNSSAFRLDTNTPLIVPEVNGHLLDEYPSPSSAGQSPNHLLIANPNCTTAAAVMVLAPIRDVAGLLSVDLCSYQAVSGAGSAALDAWAYERVQESGSREQAPNSPFHGRIADNVVPQIDILAEDGWSGEESKIHGEVRKILELPDLDIAATTVRVPVRTGHSVALHIRAERQTSVEDLETALREASGVEYRPSDGSERHPMPLDVEGRDPVLVGRLRAIPERTNAFALFLASDNLRKGAALNAVQIAESVLRSQRSQ